ncbi:MAG TPA: DUF4416 family protein [Thermodesulfobacteriota bacterium]|nr:DUF4416 family protein [Thermodesulfobacteriota bacterium]
MSSLIEPPPVKLFTGLIYGPESPLDECIRSLREGIGETDFVSPAMPFEYTGYYEEEMGASLRRTLITYKKLIKREEIVEIKVFTNKLEKVFSFENKRTINIDPGYIAQEHIILATGKGFSHRPYLGRGVYVDLTLMYKKDEFRVLEWTYPDYGSDEMRDLFRELRHKYVDQLKEETKR